MVSVAKPTELRKHPRAQLSLPARLRWRGTLGMRLEAARTLDVARDGVRLKRREPCVLGSRVWIAFPFDANSNSSVPPETPAHVVRVKPAARGGYEVALHLELPPRRPPRPPENERRACARMSFALPIFVRAPGSPWPEESMTQNISRTGARFESAQIYSAGDALLAKIPWGEWEHAGEIPARIVRVGPAENLRGPAPRADLESGVSAMLTSVAVRWASPAKPQPRSSPLRRL
ncbi:MAG: PilZ domain-containing protein [Candidatus Acidiferrales bacterium]